MKMLNLPKFFCRWRLAGLVGFALLAAVAPADLKVVSQIQTSINGDYRPTEYATTFYKGSWIRIDSKNKTILTNSATHKTITIDHLTKSYTVSEGDLSQGSAEMMQMMGAKVSAKVHPTEEQKQIAGLLSTKYLADLEFDMKIPGQVKRSLHLKMHMETWATTSLPVATEAGSILGAPNDILQSLMSLTGVGDAKKELDKVKGFSISNKISTVLDSPDAPAPISFEIDYEAVSVSSGTINPAMFRVPPDYKMASDEEDSDIPWRPAGKGG
jgi:hypothetical protein